MKRNGFFIKCILLVLLFSLFNHIPAYSLKSEKYDYLIICPDILEQTLLQYSTSLSRIGIRTYLLTYKPGEYEGFVTLKEKIKQEYYQSKIEYVTLIGSAIKNKSSDYVLPMKKESLSFHGKTLTYYTDFYYGSIINPGFSNDIKIGRIPFVDANLVLKYLLNLQDYWNNLNQSDSVMFCAPWLWMQHCTEPECPLHREDRNTNTQPPIDTIEFHPDVPMDKADLYEQIIPIYFPDCDSLYRLYELEGLNPSVRKIYADDSLTEENFIKYYNETNPKIILLSGALDNSISSIKKTPAIYRKLWKEDLNSDKKPNDGEMGYPAYLTDKTIERLKPEPNPIIISDASFLLCPDMDSIGKLLMEKGALCIIGNSGYGVTSFEKNSLNFYESGPYGSIYLESLLLRSMMSGSTISKALIDMKNTCQQVYDGYEEIIPKISLNLFGDPLIGLYHLPIKINKTLIDSIPKDGELNFTGNTIELMFNFDLVKTSKDLQDLKKSILVTDIDKNLTVTYDPKWDQASRTLYIKFPNNLTANSWFKINVTDFDQNICFHTKQNETESCFKFPNSGTILKAEFGNKRKDGNNKITDVTSKLISLMKEGDSDILITNSTFKTTNGNSKNYLFLQWRNSKNSVFFDQIPEETVFRTINDSIQDNKDYIENVNTFFSRYYNNINCTGKPVFQDKTNTIKYNWENKKPNGATSQDFFSANWKGVFEFVEGKYTFSYQSDDGIVIMIDGEKIVEEWYNQPMKARKKTVEISQGNHLIEVYYYDYTWHAGIEVKWEKQ